MNAPQAAPEKSLLQVLLKEPRLPGAVDLDSPDSVEHHAALIKSKPFLKAFYERVYAVFLKHSADLPPGIRVELGSGGGFFKELLPELVTSDIMEVKGLDKVIDACNMPFDDQTLSAVYLLDVLHHIRNVRGFFNEALRTLKPGGKIIMVEPANTFFGRFIYRNFHHEPFIPEAKDWELPEGGPMSVANGALPWIVFERDRARFDAEFKRLEVLEISYHTPLLYLLSGGVSMRQLLPSVMLPALRGIESVLSPLAGMTAMFMTVVLVRR